MSPKSAGALGRENTTFKRGIKFAVIVMKHIQFQALKPMVKNKSLQYILAGTCTEVMLGIHQQ